MNASPPIDASLPTAILAAERKERRRHRRCKRAQTVRVRPSEFVADEFDEILQTENVSREGLYFITERPTYERGMRLFVTWPYSAAPGAINMDYIARVIRINILPDGRRGVAVHLISSINLKL